MRLRNRGLIAAGAVCALTAGLAGLVQPAVADDKDAEKSFTFAVIGDIPYSTAQLAAFPKNVDQINADPAVQWVTHLGDIKSGSTQCTDAYFAQIKQNFDRFADPLVYTPGDNEWTDCHRTNNGAFNPLERLSAVRSVFFPAPGRTLGQKPAKVDSQVALGYPENVRWDRAGVSFAALHVVGSNNSLVPWTGQTAPTPEQTAEVLDRTAATIASLHETFAEAREEKNKAVVLQIQADMFDPTVTPVYAGYYAFTPIIKAIAREAASYKGQVYLFNGDSHGYTDDQPLAAGSSWLSFYGLTSPVSNLRRVTVDGSANATNYLRVTVSPKAAQVLSWEKVPFTG